MNDIKFLRGMKYFHYSKFFLFKKIIFFYSARVYFQKIKYNKPNNCFGNIILGNWKLMSVRIFSYLLKLFWLTFHNIVCVIKRILLLLYKNTLQKNFFLGGGGRHFSLFYNINCRRISLLFSKHPNCWSYFKIRKNKCYVFQIRYF